MGFPAWAVRPKGDSPSGFPAWAVRPMTDSRAGVTAQAEGESSAADATAAAAAERVVWRELYGRVAVYNEDAVSFVVRAAEWIGRGGGDGESAAGGEGAVEGGRRGAGESADAGEGEEQQEPYDLVLVDVFDGSDETPSELLDRDGPFLRALARVVHPKHGTLVLNVHADVPPPSLWERASDKKPPLPLCTPLHPSPPLQMNVHADVPPPSLWERVTCRFGDGWADESTQRGRRIHKICRAYSSALLQPSESHNASAQPNGVAFTTTTASQGNMTLVVQRGVVLGDGGEGDRQGELEGRLKEAAAAVEGGGAVPFTVAPRVVRGLKLLPGNMTLVVQRGVVVGGGGEGDRQGELEGRLRGGAAAVEEGGAVPFTVAPRVVRGLKVLLWSGEMEGRLKEGAAAVVEEGGAVPFTVAPRVVRGLKLLPVEWSC
ncbi:unnamed protein product [Closterium sp. Yama58-4]|nr:unnamed protein product [Closterium sp. Yama58-4]